MLTQQAKPSVISGIIQSANPAFIAVVVCVPIAALVYAMNFRLSRTLWEDGVL